MPSIVARIRPDREGIREQANLYGKGITPRFDHAGKVAEIHFSELSEPDARKWLTEHGYRGFTLTTDDPTPETREGKRHLSIELRPSTEIQEIDGGLLVPGVMLLAPGTWTDSSQGTPCRYTPETLERFHANWVDYSYWSRHGGGVPRSLTAEWIADIRNLRFQGGVVADLFYHGVTAASKEGMNLIRAAAGGKIAWPFSSVEMYTRDKWIISEKLYEAQEILFLGAAMVKEGACRVCRIRNNEWIQDESGESMTKKEQQAAAGSMEETQKKQQEIEMPDNKELEAQVEALKKELADLKAAQEPVKVEVPKELTDLIAAQEKTIKELSGRLEKIEKGPGDIKTKPAARDLEPTDTPEFYVPVNKKTGTVGSEA